MVWSDYEEGKDFGVYIKNNSDCIACQKKCENDANCAAVACGSVKSWRDYSGDCIWWRTGLCIDDYDVYFSDMERGYTCYKGKMLISFLNLRWYKFRFDVLLVTITIH